MVQGSENEDDHTAVGLSLQYGTTKVDHVVMGASIHPCQSSDTSSTPNTSLIRRGDSICSVEKSDVDASSIASRLASGPVGSKVPVCLKADVSGRLYEVEIVRQSSSFGKRR